LGTLISWIKSPFIGDYANAEQKARGLKEIFASIHRQQARRERRLSISSVRGEEKSLLPLSKRDGNPQRRDARGRIDHERDLRSMWLRRENRRKMQGGLGAKLGDGLREFLGWTIRTSPSFLGRWSEKTLLIKRDVQYLAGLRGREVNPGTLSLSAGYANIKNWFHSVPARGGRL